MCLGIPGQIIDIVDDANSIAKVDVSGVKRIVSVVLVRPEGIAAGDWVLIHIGFAMSKIDEVEGDYASTSAHGSNLYRRTGHAPFKSN